MFYGKTVFVGNESSICEKCTGCDAECNICSYIENYHAAFVVGTPIVNGVHLIQYVGSDGKLHYPQVGVGISGDKKPGHEEVNQIHDKVLHNARKYVSEMCLLYKSR